MRQKSIKEIDSLARHDFSVSSSSQTQGRAGFGTIRQPLTDLAPFVRCLKTYRASSNTSTAGEP
jgi:hypothetical protein